MYVKTNGTIYYYCSDKCFKMDVIYHRKSRIAEKTASAETKAKSERPEKEATAQPQTAQASNAAVKQEKK